jgi:hypothetical protein
VSVFDDASHQFFKGKFLAMSPAGEIRNGSCGLTLRPCHHGPIRGEDGHEVSLALAQHDDAMGIR